MGNIITHRNRKGNSFFDMSPWDASLCGRDKTLVPGYGYCYDCFDGYLDWEKNNNK